MKILKKKSGFTLIELMAVMAILVIISTLIFSLFLSSNKLFSRTHNQSKLQDEVRLIASQIEEDIRIGTSTGVTGHGTSKAFFTMGTPATTITYDFATALGVSASDVKLIFASRKGANDYAYVMVKDSTLPVGAVGEIKKMKCTPPVGAGSSTIVEMASLGKNVEDITITVMPASSSYELIIKVKDNNGNKESVHSLVTPRNN